jgi:hypothetical protein
MFFRKFNFYFQIFLIYLLLLGTFYLFQKYNNPIEYTISEWLINYQGGFTRRGLLGEIIHQLSKFFNFTHRELILITQVTMLCVYFVLIFKMIKTIEVDLVLALAILSPIFLSYQFSEVEVLGRKETFALIIISNIFSLNISSKIKYFALSILICVLVLIWEGIIFFIQFFLFITFVNNKFKVDKNFILQLLIIMLPAIMATYFVTFIKLSPSQMSLMCSSFNETCYNAINFLHWPLDAAISEVKTQFRLSYLFRYLSIFIIGFLPFFFILKNSKINKGQSFFGKNSILIFYSLLIFFTFPIFYIAKDWARWINITYSLSIITFIYCLKNKIVEYEVIKLKFNYLKNKIIIILIFLVFSFSWSPKTLINDDVSSIPIYRKTLNIIKYIY